MRETHDNNPYIPYVLDSNGDIYYPTDEQQEVAALMSAGATALKAARKTGIPKTTIREWEKECWFRKLKRQIASETYLQAIQRATHSIPGAIHRLQEIADSRDATPSDVLRAINALDKLADRCEGFVITEKTNDIQIAIERDNRDRDTGYH